MGLRWPRRHNSATYRSGLEVANARLLDFHRIPYEYETLRIAFVQPSKPRHYTPDYVLTNNGIIIETKGEFSAADRQKHLLVSEQYPNLDIRFVFSNPNARIYKGSPTTHAAWAEKHGFKWAGKLIPEEWIKEKPNVKSLNTIKELKECSKK